jgi:ribonuclease HI
MLKIYSDGGSRGNPGPSAFAVVVCRDGEIIYSHSKFIGTGTNNSAEYRGLIYAIGRAVDLKGEDAEFFMDSKLVINQMNGIYKVRSADLMPLYRDAKALESLITNVKFTHVGRSDPMISAADALLNKKLDEHTVGRTSL